MFYKRLVVLDDGVWSNKPIYVTTEQNQWLLGHVSFANKMTILYIMYLKPVSMKYNRYHDFFHCIYDMATGVQAVVNSVPWILGAVSIRKTVLPGMAIPMLKIRRPNGRLIFNMEIAIRR